ncbi:hypothetical protein [Paenibacillus abyssi]|uniref:Uncharacterized protein n=1 Tax=Paenibacillus abyssi TaxID=1340531 RepID=A0A917G1R2_9BACL|nr:hypothetical protein [Paenibacillus abyssi]GGG17783.1 hypothetical protein GCM10010916_38250 [Paenibacillus abyssi]
MNNGIDFSKYPVAQQIIEETELQDEIHEYPMIMMGKDETAVNMAEMLLLCKAAMAISIPLRQRSKVSSNYYLNQIRNKAHVLAQSEALREYGLSFEDLDHMVPHQNSLFGT